MTAMTDYTTTLPPPPTPSTAMPDFRSIDCNPSPLSMLTNGKPLGKMRTPLTEQTFTHPASARPSIVTNRMLLPGSLQRKVFQQNESPASSPVSMHPCLQTSSQTSTKLQLSRCRQPLSCHHHQLDEPPLVLAGEGAQVQVVLVVVARGEVDVADATENLGGRLG